MAFRILFYDGMVGFDICNDFREMEDLETCLYFLDQTENTTTSKTYLRSIEVVMTFEREPIFVYIFLDMLVHPDSLR